MTAAEIVQHWFIADMLYLVLFAHGGVFLMSCEINGEGE